jgi:DNA-binding response OmpR family regulator
MAYDGPQALAIAEKTPPDLALVDIMLPGIDGLELTRRFQAQGIPVILVTARADEVDRLVGLELGADDYITKPFSPREVVARVRAVLRRCARATEAAAGLVLQVGELSVNRERRAVQVGKSAVELTRTEFDILAAMAAHPGRVYTRLQLVEASSDDAYEGYERTIDAHIKNIRRKLGDDPKDPAFVHTVFGVGYKVEA